MYQFLVQRLSDAVTVFREGGVVMIPLLLCSVVALAVGIALALTLRRKLLMPSRLVRAIGELDKPSDVEKMLAQCHESPSPFANVMKVAIMNRNLARHENQEAVLIAGRQEASAIGRGLLVLEIVAATSPLMGLLGTVLGIVDIFNVFSKHGGTGHITMLSGGIKEALYTTVAGLTIAIPALMAHTYFTKHVDDIVLDMERFATILLTKLYSRELREEDKKGGEEKAGGQATAKEAKGQEQKG